MPLDALRRLSGGAPGSAYSRSRPAIMGTNRTGRSATDEIRPRLRRTQTKRCPPSPTGTIMRPPSANWRSSASGTVGGAHATRMASKGASSLQPS